MSRFLLLNFEDFGLNQDITKTIQPYNPFCLCCLDRDSPLMNLENCIHSDYLDSFGKSELSQYNQLICIQCHNFLTKIKYFQQQVLESFQILLSGTYTNNTINDKKMNNLTKQDTTEVLHLPPEEITIENNHSNLNIEPNSIIESNSNINEDISNSNIYIESISKSNILVEPSTSSKINVESISNMDIETNSNMHIETNSSISMAPINSNLENSFINIQIPLDNLETSRLNLELNKNIKTALDIIERNNQSFVTLGGQLQFLNGENLSFLETSLLSKEILTDIPLVPAKMSTDLENGLIDNAKLGIEIDGPEKLFYDCLDLSPELLNTGIIENEMEPIIVTSVPEPKAVKPRMKPKIIKNKPPPQIRPVRISHDELNKERINKAQSDSYLKFKFRCSTCLIGFNYEENLEDHNKRKHGPQQEDNVICDICSQLIPTVGAMTEHNYRHYTRYDCIQCGKRFPTRDEVTRHLMLSHPKVKKRKPRLKRKLKP